MFHLAFYTFTATIVTCSELHEAILKNDIVEISQLINGKIDLNAYSNNTTPLCLSLSLGSENIARMLVTAGADVHKKVTVNGISDRTALHVAAKKRLLGSALLLLTNKADVAAIDAKGYTALHLAVLSNCAEAVELLLRYGAPVDIHSDAKFKPLDFAIFFGFHHLMRTLIAGGAGLNGVTLNVFAYRSIINANGSIEIDDIGIEDIEIEDIEKEVEEIQLAFKNPTVAVAPLLLKKLFPSSYALCNAPGMKFSDLNDDFLVKLTGNHLESCGVVVTNARPSNLALELERHYENHDAYVLFRIISALRTSHCYNLTAKPKTLELLEFTPSPECETSTSDLMVRMRRFFNLITWKLFRGTYLELAWNPARDAFFSNPYNRFLIERKAWNLTLAHVVARISAHRLERAPFEFSPIRNNNNVCNGTEGRALWVRLKNRLLGFARNGTVVPEIQLGRLNSENFIF